MTTLTCDYCDSPAWGYQNCGRSKTCEQHITRPFEELKTMKTKTKDCVECGETLPNWWEDGEGDAFCSTCFTHAGYTCDGCSNEECVQCNEDSESEDEDSEMREKAERARIEAGLTALERMRETDPALYAMYAAQLRAVMKQ